MMSIDVPILSYVVAVLSLQYDCMLIYGLPIMGIIEDWILLHTIEDWKGSNKTTIPIFFGWLLALQFEATGNVTED